MGNGHGTGEGIGRIGGGVGVCVGSRILSSSSVLPAVIPSPLVWSAAAAAAGVVMVVVLLCGGGGDGGGLAGRSGLVAVMESWTRSFRPMAGACSRLCSCI